MCECSAATNVRCTAPLLLTRSEADDQDDEESKEWEMAQIRRAGKYDEEKPEVAVKKGYVPAKSRSLWHDHPILVSMLMSSA